MSWPAVEVTEVARVVGGATPKSAIEEFWDGDVNWVTPKDLSNLDGKYIAETPRKITAQGLRSCAAELLPANSVLFSSRAPIGHVAINAEPMATNQGFKSFVPGPDLDASFLYWWLDANRSYLQSLGTGATFKEVSKVVVQRIKIPLPPLEEQRRIAGILDQADALRRLRTRALDKLNTLGQAIFHEMFGDHTESNSKVALGDVCDVRDGTHDSPKYVEDGFPLLTSKNFSSGKLSMVGAKKISEDDYVKINKRSKVDIGDIVMPMIGTIGSPVIIEEPPSFAIKNVALIKFQETSPKASFVHALLSSDYLDRIVKKQGRGGTQKFVSLGDLRKLEFQLPSAAKQSEFELRANRISAQCYAHETALAATEALFASVQHRAFRGEL